AVLDDLDDLLFDRLPDPVQLLRAAGERELRDGAAGLADARRCAPVRDDAERRLALELEKVGEQVQLLRHIAVPGQSAGHVTMICGCLTPSSAFPRTTSARTSSRCCARSATRACACSSSTTTLPTALARSPTGSLRSSPTWTSSTASGRKGSGLRTSAA